MLIDRLTVGKVDGWQKRGKFYMHLSKVEGPLTPPLAGLEDGMGGMVPWEILLVMSRKKRFGGFFHEWSLLKRFDQRAGCKGHVLTQGCPFWQT